MSFTAQSLYLPNWFVRRRALAIGIAFSGVSVGPSSYFPAADGDHPQWLACVVPGHGSACPLSGWPLNLLVRGRPENLGLAVDGDQHPAGTPRARDQMNIVDPEWAAIQWTLPRAMRTARF